MAKRRKTPASQFSSLILKAIKQEVNQKSGDLIENVLKPKHIQPPPTGHQLNYITDITIKWLGSKCYFVSIYACPGPNAISPTFETKFTKKAELSTFLLIYNAKTDATNKPDVSVEYNFYAKQGGSEKFFNKTNPQNLNAQTLPREFDFAAGHQLQSGQAVPLASFPEGDYRLEIKVTDKIANKTLTRDVNFSVSGS